MSLKELEGCACPRLGTCAGMFTANSMNCLTEAIGMGLPGNGTIPAVFSERIRLAKKAGMKIMELMEKGITPAGNRDPEGIQERHRRGHGLRLLDEHGSSSAAMRYEAGIDLDLDDFDRMSKRRPISATCLPQGRTIIEDLYRAGGVQAVMKRLSRTASWIGRVMTVTVRR